MFGLYTPTYFGEISAPLILLYIASEVFPKVVRGNAFLIDNTSKGIKRTAKSSFPSKYYLSNMSSKIIAIIGATGNQGGSVLNTFASSGKYKVRALTRNPNSDTATQLKSKYPNVEWVKANLNSVDTLRKAFSGAHAVFGVTQFADPDNIKKLQVGDLDAEFDQGKNIIDAAIAENVQIAIMSTLPSIAKASNDKYTKVLHFEGKYKIAQYLDSKSNQIKGVNVYLGYFMENYVSYSRISDKDNKTVEFTCPLKPTTLLPLVDTVNDTGPVVEYALEHADEYQGKPILVSSGRYEAQEMAKAFTEVAGESGSFVQIPYDAFGMEEFSQMFQWYDEFGYFDGFDLDKFNKNLNHHFATPKEFWKSRGWTGPSK